MWAHGCHFYIPESVYPYICLYSLFAETSNSAAWKTTPIIVLLSELTQTCVSSHFLPQLITLPAHPVTYAGNLQNHCAFSHEASYSSGRPGGSEQGSHPSGQQSRCLTSWDRPGTSLGSPALHLPSPWIVPETKQGKIQYDLLPPTLGKSVRSQSENSYGGIMFGTSTVKMESGCFLRKTWNSIKHKLIGIFSN